MKNFTSEVKEGSKVSFPEYTGERVYMVPFYQKDGLPQELKRWQPTVDQMLKGIKTDSKIYIMIDQSFVKKGESQRRGGLHIDGYWLEEQSRHGNGHSGSQKKYQKWEDSDFSESEALILASNISASRGFVGEFSGAIQDKGDCSHIKTDKLKEISLEANKTYIGNVTFLHESLPVEKDCFRTLVRLNVPNYSF